MTAGHTPGRDLQQMLGVGILHQQTLAGICHTVNFPAPNQLNGIGSEGGVLAGGCSIRICVEVDKGLAVALDPGRIVAVLLQRANLNDLLIFLILQGFQVVAVQRLHQILQGSRCAVAVVLSYNVG